MAKGQIPEEEYTLDNPNKFLYLFLVDRSGSMSGSRMTTTVEALKLFMKSLPPGCMFDIISYGTVYKSYTQTGRLYDK